jgi:hypothetical protein
MSIKAIPISPTIQNVASFYTGLPANSKVYDCPSSSYNPTKPVECFDKNITGYNQGTLSAGFKEQVMAMVQHLQNHFTSNAALNNDDLQLIAISKIPVYQMAQAMQDAGMAGQIANVLSGYSEYIAYSLTQTLMSEVNAMARSALSARNVQSNDQAKQAVMDLTSRINSIQSQLNIDGQKYANQDIVAMLQKINFLRSSAMAQYSPAMTEKIQFARAFNNN